MPESEINIMLPYHSDESYYIGIIICYRITGSIFWEFQIKKEFTFYKTCF